MKEDSATCGTVTKRKKRPYQQVLRRTYGPKYINNERRPRSNMSNVPDTTSTIKSRRTQWLGHIRKMATERAVKWICEDKPSGRRIVRRPKLRWMVGRMVFKVI
jgi:hypothetical protein